MDQTEETATDGEIEAIDRNLARLATRRIALAAESPAIDRAYERRVVSSATEGATPEEETALRQFFATVFGLSGARRRAKLRGEPPIMAKIREAARAAKPLPSRAVVACAGTEGSYSQEAATLMFPMPTILYFNGFEAVFEAVEKGLCPYGILPVENSAAGSVAAVYDLMVRHRFHIVRALRLKVSHVLLAPHGVRLEDVKEVSSHPHALAQGAAFLKAHPAMATTPATNTAAAAKELAASGRHDMAVIASRECAELYGLDVIAEGIADAAFNYTRFICISKNLETTPDAGKFSIMLSLPHRPGALNSIISKFAAIDVNLTKLESRPVPGMDFEFRFTFDFEAPPTDPAVLALLSEIAQDPAIEHFTFLGAYAEK